MKTKIYIAYDAGSNIWNVEPYNKDIEWHKNEHQGTKEQCEKEAHYQMFEANQPHYSNASYGSIWDY